MSTAIQNMNGTLWVFAGVLIAMVIFQSTLFLRLTMKFNKENKVLTKDEIKTAATTGIVASIGPAFSATIIALSLIAMVGPAVTFMRCGVIGAPSWELMMADIVAQTMGVEMGSAEFTESIFVLAIFGMTWASAPYFLNTILTLKPLDKAAQSASANPTAEKKESFLPIMGTAAIMGILGNNLLGYLGSVPMVTGLIIAAIGTYAISTIAKKPENRWMNSWNMAVSVLIAMGIAQTVSTMIG